MDPQPTPRPASYTESQYTQLAIQQNTIASAHALNAAMMPLAQAIEELRQAQREYAIKYPTPSPSVWRDTLKIWRQAYCPYMLATLKLLTAYILMYFRSRYF